MQYRSVNKSLDEMNLKELMQASVLASGLPEPNDNASKEERIQWSVAGTFMLYFRGIDFSGNPLAAKIAATNSMLKGQDYQEKLPYIEIGLGRKLTEAEILARQVLVM